MGRPIAQAIRSQGVWGYAAGVDGTAVVTGGRRVLCIAAHCGSAGSMSINGGDSIPIPANTQVTLEPVGNLVDPTITFVGTDSFFVETVT